jgi:tetratricopeptide (TPR) repeat protein
MQAIGRFESLGGDAEVAVVQRRCGVSAGGALAWARNVAIVDLVRLLDARFDGLFDSDEVELADDGTLLDRRYDLRMSAAAPPEPSDDDATRLEALLRERAKARQRAAATLARLETGRAFCLYKCHRSATSEQILALHAGLRRFGDNALLIVTAGGAAPAVERLDRDLYGGRISAFGTGETVLEGVRVAEWEALCRQAWRLHGGPTAAPTMPRPATTPPPATDAPARKTADLAAAVRLHRDGNLTAAASAYRALLERNPRDADALHLLGLVRDAEGHTAQALDLIGRAIAENPSPRFLANRGLILARLGRLDDAVAAYRQALAVQPDHADALNNLGVALAAQGKPEEAAAAHRQALASRPGFAEAQFNLGHALGLLGDVAAAEAAFRAAFALRPALNPAPAPGAPRRLLCVAADGAMPGATYRCAHLAEAATAAGWQARWLPLGDVREGDLRGLRALLFWRGELTGPVARVVAYARAAGARVGLDLDDLICDPDLADIGTIDGIRSVGTTEAATRVQFGRVQALLQAADFAVASTAELAARMRRPGLPVWVLPNGFSEATLIAARKAVRARQHAPAGGGPRIGYAAGTRTHQRDLAPVAATLASVLRARPEARLVLFRAPNGPAMLDLHEYPDLAALPDRIEWRDLVPLSGLPAELARFDINIAPVEVGNPFAEAKSELKFFEAALAGVPTVASPTGPFRRAIRHGQTGLLAETPGDWEAALLALIDTPAERARLAQSAYHEALWRFGPQRRATLVASLLAELAGGAEAARAFAAAVACPSAAGPPAVPAGDNVFDSDDGRPSRVTVVLTSPDTERDPTRALSTVDEQTLPDLDVVVIAADPDAAGRAVAWLRAHAGRFHRAGAMVLPGGLDAARNAGFAWAETPWVLSLATHQRLRPGAAEALLAAAEEDGAAFAYRSEVAAGRYDPRGMPGVRAPPLLAKWAWAAASGYDASSGGALGLWCRLAEHGLHGIGLAEPLWHAAAADATTSPDPALLQRHPWLADLMAP